MAKDIFDGRPGEYTYTQSPLGKTAEGVLVVGKGQRNPAAQRKVGGSHREAGDDGTHLIADRFKGSGKEKNQEAFHRSINRGSYKRMENRLAKLAGNKENRVHMKVSSHRRAGVGRPDVLIVTNSLRRKDGSADQEHLSFVNLSKKDQEAIHREMASLDIPIRQTGLTKHQRELAKRYAEKNMEMPLGDADIIMKKGRDQMSRNSDFEARIKVGPEVQEALAQVHKQFAQKAKKAPQEDHSRQRVRASDEGGREMGGSSRGKSPDGSKTRSAAKSAATGAENSASANIVFPAQKRGNTNNVKQAGNSTTAAKSRGSFLSGMLGKSRGNSASATGGKSLGGGKGFGGKGLGGGKGFGGGKGLGGGKGR